MNMNRRHFLKFAGAAAGLAGFPYVSVAADLLPADRRRVVVVGGGYGGTIAAKTVRQADPTIEVVLVERNKAYVSCPFSNLVVGGSRTIEENTIGYDALTANHGIKVIHDEVIGVNAADREIRLKSGTLGYSRLILSPGIDFRFDEIENYDPAETPKIIPHAWKAGEQTLLLRRQLEQMPDGGTVIVTIPLTPFRCPPGPYERICQMAWYLKHNKPKSRIVVLDANQDIASKAALFRKAWATHYPDMIDYNANNKIIRVNARHRSVDNGVEEIRGDVVNVIPPQKAGLIAHLAGTVGPDGKWCPVDQTTFESTQVRGIHVIGDACSAGTMPKSGYSANSQAKVCGLNVVQLMNGRQPVEPSLMNVCYSYVTDRQAISVAAVYRVINGNIIALPDAGGVSADLSEDEGTYARSWIRNMLLEMST